MGVMVPVFSCGAASAFRPTGCPLAYRTTIIGGLLERQLALFLAWLSSTANQTSTSEFAAGVTGDESSSVNKLGSIVGVGDPPLLGI